MLIKQGQHFTVKDKRKGKFKGEALRDFDTEKDDFYPVATLEYVEGMTTEWFPGDEIPCRKGISEIVPEVEPNEVC